MARGDKQSILDDIVSDVAQGATENQRNAAAAAFDLTLGGELKDFVEIGGVKYFRDQVQAADPNRRIKKPYVNPKRPNDAPVEMELEQIAINVAPYADGITLDSVKYLAGRVYEVPVAVAATMRDIIQNTWRHESSTGGAYSHGAAPVHGSAGQVGKLAPGIAFG